MGLLRSYIILALLLPVQCLLAEPRISLAEALARSSEAATVGERMLPVVSITSSSFDFPPYTWIDQRSGEEQGLSVEVLRKLSAELERTLLLIDGGFDNKKKYQEALAAMEAGTVTLLSSMYRSTDPRPYLLFPAQPLYTLDVKVYVLAEDLPLYSGWDSLVGKRGAAANLFSTSSIDNEQFRAFEQLPLDIKAESQIIRMFEQLAARELDYLILPSAVTEAQLYFFSRRGLIVSIDPPLGNVPVYMPFAKNMQNDVILTYFNQRIAEMRDSGELQLMESRLMRDYLAYRRATMNSESSEFR